MYGMYSMYTRHEKLVIDIYIYIYIYMCGIYTACDDKQSQAMLVLVSAA